MDSYVAAPLEPASSLAAHDSRIVVYASWAGLALAVVQTRRYGTLACPPRAC